MIPTMPPPDMPPLLSLYWTGAGGGDLTTGGRQNNTAWETVRMGENRISERITRAIQVQGN